MYEHEDFSNDKAAGVCYNNLANLHLKNGKYNSAAINFQQSIEKAKKC